MGTRRNCQMASKGKKGRGGKGKTLNLTEFLGPDGGGSTYKAPGAAGTVAVGCLLASVGGL